RRNLLPPRLGSLRLSSNQHASRRLHHRFSLDLRNGPVLLLREAFPVQLFFHNRMGRCVAPPIIHSIHKSTDQNAMGRCGLCMQHVSVIVARVRSASSVRESATTLKARRVSAVYWPVSSSSSISEASPPAPED